MKRLLKLVVGLSLAVGMWSCTHPAWEEHYSVASGNVIDKTLKEALLADKELSQFVAYLEEMNYLDQFAYSQSYTIWAPTNDAWVGFDDTDKRNLLQTLKNHVSRYPYLTSDVSQKSVNLHLMDNKRVLFHKEGDDFYFGSKKLVAYDQAYKNGILHKISGVEPYVQNIYEYIQYTDGLDSLRAFINSYQTTTFDESQSLVLGVNDQGETVYDSVFVSYNNLFSEYYLGYINDEEETYTTLLPTNEAWKKMYELYYPYRNLHPFVLPLPASGDPVREPAHVTDSIRDDVVKKYILQYLTFGQAMTPDEIANRGSMYTIGGQRVIKDMNDYFESSYGTYKELSNGVVYTTDELRLDPSYWCETYKIEAEMTYNHYYIPNIYIAEPDSMAMSQQKQEESVRDLYRRETHTSWMDSAISEHAYLEVNSRSDQVAPTVAFDLSGMALSNVDYNVKVVFLPDRIFRANTPNKKYKPVPVRFSISYMSEDGGVATSDYRHVQYTDPMNADTVLVTAEEDGTPAPIRLPYSSTLMSLKVISDIQPLQDTVYSRNMLIDCIILEPVL